MLELKMAKIIVEHNIIKNYHQFMQHNPKPRFAFSLSSDSSLASSVASSLSSLSSSF